MEKKSPGHLAQGVQSLVPKQNELLLPQTKSCLVVGAIFQRELSEHNIHRFENTKGVNVSD